MAGLSQRPRGQRVGIELIPGSVRRARLDAELSINQLAHPYYSREALRLVESGKRRVSRAMLLHIAEKTDRPVEFFLGASDPTAEQRGAIEHLRNLVATAAFAEAIAAGERLLLDDPPREIEAEVRFLVGRACVRSTDAKHAYAHLVKARNLFELLGDEVQLADTLNQMACSLVLLDDARAIRIAHEALDVCERLEPEQHDLLVRTLILLGGIFFRLQDFGRAERCYLRALQTPGSTPTIRNVAMAHDQLNMTYQRMGRFSDALGHAHKAMRLYGGSLDPTDFFRAVHNLGESLLRQGELRAARPHLERALTLCEQRGLQRYFLGFALLSMAELHLGCGEMDRAESRINEALKLANELGERAHQANAWRLRGRLLSWRGEHGPASRAFNAAVELFRELELPVDVFDTQLEHARALRAHGRIDEACKLFDEAGTNGQDAIHRVRAGWPDLMIAEGRR